MNLDPIKIAEHVKDANAFEFPFGYEWHLPVVHGFQVTKFMVLEVVAAVLMILVFVPIARKMTAGTPPKGRFWNLFEVFILFIRNQVVRPAVGKKDANRFLPLILSLFFFILFCNLLGLVPWMGSPTASINVTAPLALVVFLAGIISGMRKFGVLGFWLGLCPKLDLPFAMKIVLVPMVLVLEIVGLLIKHCVLAVRLLANLFGGHLVLALIMGFIPAVASSPIWYGVAPMTVLGGTAISMLELFIAFLQAYIFAFLAALFIGMNVHQH